MFIHTEADRERLEARSLRFLLASQVLSGAGLAAGVTVGALLAEDMLGTTGLSGLRGHRKGLARCPAPVADPRADELSPGERNGHVHVDVPCPSSGAREPRRG